MSLLQPYSIQCPYCCQSLMITVDCSVGLQEYIEDCQICCRPVLLRVETDGDQSITVDARMENE